MNSAGDDLATVRIGFYGNICNNLYQIAKALRVHSDIETHLFLDSKSDMQQLPESDDPELAGSYPSWIHVGQYATASSFLMPWRATLVRDLARFDFDLIVASGVGPIHAFHAGPPVAFLTAGADVTMLPFPLRFLGAYPTLKSQLAALLTGGLQRAGIRRCSEVWTQPFYPFLDALARLGVPPDRISDSYFPIILDTDRIRYRSNAQESNLKAVHEITALSPDFIVFHPARMFIEQTPKIVESGRFKGNDVLIRGFAEFVKRKCAKRPLLVLLDREVSGDTLLARDLIASLGIQEHVIWVQGPRGYGFTRDELIDLYSLADVVADDFSVGWFGSIVLEGLAVERPVISYVDEDAMKKLYPWHPLLSSRSPEGVADHMERLGREPEYKAEQGRLGREWVVAFHSTRAAGERYVTNVKSLLQRLSNTRSKPTLAGRGAVA